MPYRVEIPTGPIPASKLQGGSPITQVPVTSVTTDGLTDFSAGRIKAVRAQCTEWEDLKIDDNTTGILICSTVLDADVWFALREDFKPDPDLPSLAIFYPHEIPFLKDKTRNQLRKIHQSKLVSGSGTQVRQ